MIGHKNYIYQYVPVSLQKLAANKVLSVCINNLKCDEITINDKNVEKYLRERLPHTLVNLVLQRYKLYKLINS
tara:strand:- start:360 stop:578 length:219 start_codon:yes stop_codon:yes gene_type:complete